MRLEVAVPMCRAKASLLPAQCVDMPLWSGEWAQWAGAQARDRIVRAMLVFRLLSFQGPHSESVVQAVSLCFSLKTC